MYFHDGAPPHFGRPVTEWLNNRFPNESVGRNGPETWLARTLDLNRCDFGLKGWMKQLVYRNQQCPEAIEELQRVEVAAATVCGTPGVC